MRLIFVLVFCAAFSAAQLLSFRVPQPSSISSSALVAEKSQEAVRDADYSRHDDPSNYDRDGNYVSSFASLENFYKVPGHNGRAQLFRYNRVSPGIRRAQVIATTQTAVFAPRRIWYGMRATKETRQGVERFRKQQRERTQQIEMQHQAWLRYHQQRMHQRQMLAMQRHSMLGPRRQPTPQQFHQQQQMQRWRQWQQWQHTQRMHTQMQQMQQGRRQAPQLLQQSQVQRQKVGRARRGKALASQSAESVAEGPAEGPSQPATNQTGLFNPGFFSAFPGGSRKIIAFQVFLADRGCGTAQRPQECAQNFCSAQRIQELLTGRKSVNEFYHTASRGLVNLTFDPSELFRVTIAGNTDMLDIPSEIERVLGNKEADHFVYFLPQNYQRDSFADGKAQASGLYGGKATWVKQCDLSFVTHELGHNFAMGHSGGDVNGKFQEYFDLSSIMSLSGEGKRFNVGSFRGLGAPQLWHLSWLPASGMIDVMQDGSYTIAASLSSNGNVRAARVFTASKNRPIWLEYRELVNQDTDLDDAAQVLQNKLKLDRHDSPFLGSFLVKELLPGRNTRLVGVIPPDGSAVINGVNITRIGQYGFSVEGIGSPEAEKVNAPSPKYARALADSEQPDFVVRGDLVEIDTSYPVTDGNLMVSTSSQYGPMKISALQPLN